MVRHRAVAAGKRLCVTTSKVGCRTLATNEARGTARGWRRWIVRRRRNVKLTGRESDRGHAVRRKPGPKQLGRANIPWCLSDITPTSLPGPMTCIRTSRKNHPQLSLFSLSTKANARGTSALSASHAMATKSVPMYLTKRNVPSMDNTERQCLKASTLWGKHQNARQKN